MGSHAKPRTTGRKTALSALALGATLTGVGLTAAALDPATAVLTASGADEGGATQLSGLSTPVADDLGPAAGGVGTLSSAPFGTVGSLTNAVNGTASGALEPAGSLAKAATSGTLEVSTTSGRQTGVKPIRPGAPVPAHRTASSPSPASSAAASGSGAAPATGYVGRHVKIRSAAPPSDTTPLAGAATSGAASAAASVLPLAQGLVAKIPVVSSLVPGSGVAGTAGGLLGTAAGTVGGTASGSSGDPVAGAAGGLPLAGTLLGGSGGSGGGLSSLVPRPSSLSGLL